MINTVIIMNGSMVWRLERGTGREESGCFLKALPLPGGVTLGKALGLGLAPSLPCLGCGSKGPRDALKPLDGPGLVPRILLLTAASQTAQGQGDKSKSWFGITETGVKEAKGENTMGVVLSLHLTLISSVSSFYVSVLLSVCSRIRLLSKTPEGLDLICYLSLQSY